MSAGAIQTSYAVTDVIGYNGMLADDSENDLITAVNNDSVSIPFGAVLQFKTSSPPSDFSAQLPTSAAAKLMGILVQEHDYERTYTLPDGTLGGQLDATGIVVGAVMTLLRRGAIWVTVLQAVKPGDRLYVSFEAGSSFYTASGQIGNADDGSNTVTGAHQIGQFETTAAAGAIAKLRVDFTIGPAVS
jgi:hypothetical protein